MTLRMTISSSIVPVREISNGLKRGSGASLLTCDESKGQIELYTHFPIMSRLVQLFQTMDIRLCACYLLESQFMEDKSKFFSGVLSAMSCMINLEVPHINLMSKMDLIKQGKTASKSKRELER